MSTARFTGRRALVTGASRGIGAGIAQRLAAEGAAVALVARTLDAHDHLAGSLRVVGDRITAAGGRAELLVADLSDPQGRSRIVPDVVDRLGGPIDILINNAAAAMYRNLSEMPLKRRRIMFEVNVHAPLDLIQAALPAMVGNGAGWIVNLSSAAARRAPGPPFSIGFTGTTNCVYGASKAALNRITNGLGAELYGTGIRVNTIEPRAAVLTEGADELVGASLSPDQIEPLEAMVEATVALCDCEPDITGNSFVSVGLLEQWGIKARGLDGRPIESS